ncbi:hypothetical protein [Bifidobacterium mongoliense]|uniref:hypothetical protein n=1 Tax=Bifidobacterium mongoliense TaxID=518643 RepID=UPI00264809B8|nr:hypothetical protein [Bifidobacterium mongoliense]MDN5979167.1 hypothetical protein [Bifidobacterium mongoliense]MDN6016881.1 hypothetical protein [Bifidobacterium mongoliense]MDN6783413.1 hypothetical protein [Bifidobacterium mongoliense]
MAVLVIPLFMVGAKVLHKVNGPPRIRLTERVNKAFRTAGTLFDSEIDTVWRQLIDLVWRIGVQQAKALPSAIRIPSTA